MARTRSVDSVSESARVLARREAVSRREARLVVRPPSVPAKRLPEQPVQQAPAAPEVEAPLEGPRPAAGAPKRFRVRLVAQRKAAAAAARRRRFILAALVVMGAATAVATALGRLPSWSPAVPLVVTAAFLVLARVTVRREQSRWEAELRDLEALAAAAPEPRTDQAVIELVAVAPVEEAPVEEPPVTVAQPAAVEHDAALTTDRGSLWDPLPVTLPTYVSKPRASRSVRTIDLQAPGVSSSGHDAASSALVADAATSSPPDDVAQRAVGS